MNEDTLIRRKILDTANRSYRQNIYTYTGFLSLSELAVYYSMQKELNFIKSTVFGGNDSCERAMIQFGSAEELGYEEEFPITLILVTPLTPKFAEKLNHRDYLGAIMNLGIERGLIGDIVIKENAAYIYCQNHISDFITDNLSTIKHTHVKCSVCSDALDGLTPELEPLEIIAASPRTDAVVAAITKMSRSSVIELFRTKKIFVNGKCMENNSGQLKENDILVIRGTGKFIYLGSGNETRKGRVYIQLKKYV